MPAGETYAPDRFLPVGTKVRIGGHHLEVPHYKTRDAEFGVVIHCWKSEELGGLHDCYIAFFGSEFPAGEPEIKPYVLRYAVVGIDVLDEQVS